MGIMKVVRRFGGLPLLAVFLAACGDDGVAPTSSTPLAGRYTLSWFAQRDAPALPGVPGTRFVIDECGNGADQPNAAFTFSDSTALTLQQTPQAYALTVTGLVTDCSGTTTEYFDIATGEYLFVDDEWLTLQGDLTHPHLDGTLLDTGDTLRIEMRPGQPGLPYPLRTIDRLVFSRVK
jgi:hypothetical protein